MANIKDSKEIEALHNEWCRENGYPIRKRQARFPGRPKLQAKLQAASKGPARGQQCAIR